MMDQVCDRAAHCIWRISGAIRSAVAGVSASSEITLSLVAGTPGDEGKRNGRGKVAQFCEPLGITVNPVDDSIYVSDFGNRTIRRITSDGEVSTIAGEAPRSYDDSVGWIQDGSNLSIQFRGPANIILDPSSANLDSDSLTFYITDGDHIRRMIITPQLLGPLRALSSTSGSSFAASSSSSSSSSSLVSAESSFALPDPLLRIVVAYVPVDVELKCIAGTTKYDDGASEDNDSEEEEDDYGDDDEEAKDEKQRKEDARLSMPQGLCIVRHRLPSAAMVDRLIISDSARHRLASIQLPSNPFLPRPTLSDVTAPFTVLTITAEEESFSKSKNKSDPHCTRSVAERSLAWASVSGVCALTFDSNRNRMFLSCGDGHGGCQLWMVNGSNGVMVLIASLRKDWVVGCCVDPTTGDCIASVEHALIRYRVDGSSERFAGRSLPSPPKSGYLSKAAREETSKVEEEARRQARGLKDGHRLDAAMFRECRATVFDSKGNLYACDEPNHSIRRVDAVTGQVTTIAGTGIEPGYSDGIGRLAQFKSPDGIVIDTTDNDTIYVCDTGNGRIRAITQPTLDDPDYHVTTVAGGNSRNHGKGTKKGKKDSFLDGVATSATFSSPSSIVFDRLGSDSSRQMSTFYLADVHDVYSSVRQLTVLHRNTLRPFVTATWSGAGDVPLLLSSYLPATIEQLILDYIPRAVVVTVAGKPASNAKVKKSASAKEKQQHHRGLEEQLEAEANGRGRKRFLLHNSSDEEEEDNSDDDSGPDGIGCRAKFSESINLAIDDRIHHRMLYAANMDVMRSITLPFISSL
jgi:hypothetical protein